MYHCNSFDVTDKIFIYLFVCYTNQIAVVPEEGR